MGLITGLLGHAKATDLEKITERYEEMLLEDETVQQAYKLVRDTFIFTNKRLLLIDIQGVTGKKRSHMTIPYRSVTRFSKESQGLVDIDAELLIWVRDQPEPLRFEFAKDSAVNDIYVLLTYFTCRGEEV